VNYKFKIIKICEFQEVFDDLLKLLKVRYPRRTISEAITVTRIQSLKLKKKYFIFTGNTNDNNNNNNNNHDNVCSAIIMTKVIARVHPVHLMNVD